MVVRGEVGDTFMGVLEPESIWPYSCVDFLYACWNGLGCAATAALENCVAMFGSLERVQPERVGKSV